MKLNLGCGDHSYPGWVNIDIIQRKGSVGLFANVLSLPFAPGTIDVIYAGHLIEHMFPNESRPAILHWWDLLTPGGCLGVLTPDIQRMWRMHRDAGHFTMEDLDGAIGKQGRDPADPFSLHVTIWTQEQLVDYVSGITGAPGSVMDITQWPVEGPEWDWQVGVKVTK